MNEQTDKLIPAPLHKSDHAREQVIKSMRVGFLSVPGGESCTLHVQKQLVRYTVWVGSEPYTADTLEEAIELAHAGSGPGMKLRQARELRAKADTLEAEARTLIAIASSSTE